MTSSENDKDDPLQTLPNDQLEVEEASSPKKTTPAKTTGMYDSVQNLIK